MFSKVISITSYVITEDLDHQDITAWSYDTAGHAQKCVERYCELAHKTVDQLHKVTTLCLHDHQVKPRDMNMVGGLAETCSQIVLTCLYLARLGRPDSLWTVQCLARSVTKWNRACDLRPVRSISYIHHTPNDRQYCHEGNQATNWKLGFFQDADFAGKLTYSKSNSSGVLCIFESHTFVPVSWKCKKANCYVPQQHRS